MKQIKIMLITLALLVGAVFAIAPAAFAQEIPIGCPGATLQGPPAPGTVCPDGSTPNGPPSSPSRSGDVARVDGDCKQLTTDCKIVSYIIVLINVLTAVVGVIIVIMVVVGGIQYSAAQDNPQATQAAKKKIINAIIALIAYIFTSAFLQWVVPGGVF